jgi:hypothetical protein
MHIVVSGDRRYRRSEGEEAGAVARALGRVGRLFVVVGGRGAQACAVSCRHGDGLGHEMVHQNTVGVDAGFRRWIMEHWLLQTATALRLTQKLTCHVLISLLKTPDHSGVLPLLYYSYNSNNVNYSALSREPPSKR